MIELSDGNVNLIIDEAEQNALRDALGTLTGQEGIVCALLIDTAGKVITVSGSAGHLDTATIAALAAGDHATTRALARRVGEKDFSLMFQRDKHLNAFLHAVSDEALLVVLFNENIPVGGVRVSVKQAQIAVRKILLRARRTITGPEEVRRLLEERSAPAAEGVPPAAPLPAGSTAAPAAPSADQIRAFWRIKGLAEDCIRIGVPKSRPREWQLARDRIGTATVEMAGGAADRARSVLEEAERLLRTAYESALELNRHTATAEQEWEGIEYFHALLDVAAEPFTRLLGETGTGLLPHVDRDSRDRHPAVLPGDGPGRIERATLAALGGLTVEQRRQSIARALLDLLINRLLVVRKIFGAAASRTLVEAWRTHASASTETLNRLGLHPAIRFLFDDAVRRWPDLRDGG